MKNIVDEIIESIPSHEKRANRISNDISAQIFRYMKELNINQRQLAEKLGKKESEISKWLNGNHNFTIETIAKIEDVFNKNILMVPIFAYEDMNLEFKPIVHNIIDVSSSWFISNDKYLNYDIDRYPNIKKERLNYFESLGEEINLLEEKLDSTEKLKNGTYY